MTISITPNDASVDLTVTDAGQAVYAFDFLALDADAVLVSVISGSTVTALDQDGGEYTVSGLAVEGGGTITLDAGVSRAVDDVIRIERLQPIRRLNDYVTAGDFRAPVINAELQRMTLVDQDVRRDVDRKLGLDEATRTKFDAGGKKLTGLAAGTADTDAVRVDQVAALIADDLAAASAAATAASDDADAAAASATAASTSASTASAAATAAGDAQTAAEAAQVAAEAAAAAAEGDVTGPEGATLGHLAMLDATGKVLYDSGIPYVRFLDGPVYAREYGLTPAGSYPGNTDAATALAQLVAAHNYAIDNGRELWLPPGDIWLYATSTAAFELGLDIEDISRGGAWKAAGRCQIHSSYINDAGGGPEIKFQVSRGSLVGDLSSTNFWIGDHIHFITDNPGVQIQIGNPGDGADNIFYNEIEFHGAIRSNTDNAANRLLRLYSQYDMEIYGSIINAGATSPISGSRCIEFLGSDGCKFFGTAGGVDIGVYSGDGGAGFVNSGLQVRGRFEQTNTDWIADSGTLDGLFAAERATAFQTLVDARAGSTGRFAPVSMQQEGSYSPFNRLKLENDGVKWTQNFGEWVEYSDSHTYGAGGSAEELMRFGLTVGPDEIWEIEFFITQVIHTSGFIGFRTAAKGRGIAMRAGSANLECNATIYGDNPLGNTITCTADTGTQEIVISCNGNPSSTFERSYGWRMRQVK